MYILIFGTIFLILFILLAVFIDKVVAKVIFGILSVGVLVILFFVGDFIYATEIKLAEVDRKTSPDKEYTLIMDSVGEPAWPFGPAKGKLILKRGSQKIAKLFFTISDDGCPIHDNSWKVTWNDDCVTVVFSGSEMYDQEYKIYYADGSHVNRQLDTHYGKKDKDWYK